MENIINFFTDDWKKIPQNYRYLIIFGLFLIFNSWLLSNWNNNTPSYFGLDIINISYSIGLTFILIAFFIFILPKQFYALAKTIWYRHKYPIDKLDEDYYLVWFNGKLMLFDNKSKPKKYFHVLPWETAQNLLFVGLGFEANYKFEPNKINEFIVNQTGKKLNLKNFKNGGTVNTQI